MPRRILLSQARGPAGRARPAPAQTALQGEHRLSGPVHQGEACVLKPASGPCKLQAASWPTDLTVNSSWEWAGRPREQWLAFPSSLVPTAGPAPRSLDASTSTLGRSEGKAERDTAAPGEAEMSRAPANSVLEPEGHCSQARGVPQRALQRRKGKVSPASPSGQHG